MSVKAFSQKQNFRNAFNVKGVIPNLVSWYPGHMAKDRCNSIFLIFELHLALVSSRTAAARPGGMRQMQRKLVTVDCIIEVHDARIPFSGRNPQFYNRLTAIKPHIFVLNKMDLIDMTLSEKIEKQLKNQNINNVIFTNCKVDTKGNVDKILPLAVELINDTQQFGKIFKNEYGLMVIGIPNVGKSSLINRLRNIHLKKKSSNAVGAAPGITRSVLERVKINEHPRVYLYDTPGVMEPHLNNIEVGLRLALCCTLKDHLVGEELIADYLLYWLNKHRNFSYVEYLGIPSAIDEIKLLLLQVATLLNKTLKIRNFNGDIVTVPDLKAAARYFIKAFRAGEFGKLLLDVDTVNKG